MDDLWQPDTGLEYLANHLPNWNESGGLLSLELLDEFFSLSQSIYLDIWEHYGNHVDEREKKMPMSPNCVTITHGSHRI
jgi:hypothetical protein